jgi:hypothetical protein
MMTAPERQARAERKYKWAALRVVGGCLLLLGLSSVRLEMLAHAQAGVGPVIAAADGSLPGTDDAWSIAETLLARHGLNAVLGYLLVRFGPDLLRKHLALLESTSLFVDSIKTGGAVCQAKPRVESIHDQIVELRKRLGHAPGPG